MLSPPSTQSPPHTDGDVFGRIRFAVCGGSFRRCRAAGIREQAIPPLKLTYCMGAVMCTVTPPLWSRFHGRLPGLMVMVRCSREETNKVSGA